MFDYDQLAAAMDELGYDGVKHASRYLLASRGKRDVGPFDEVFARAALGLLTDEQRENFIAYVFALFVQDEMLQESHR